MDVDSEFVAMRVALTFSNPPNHAYWMIARETALDG